MRQTSGGVGHVAGVIGEDLASRDTNLYKSHISGISDLAAAALACRSSNTGEWISCITTQDW